MTVKFLNTNPERIASFPAMNAFDLASHASRVKRHIRIGKAAVLPSALNDSSSETSERTIIVSKWPYYNIMGALPA